MTANLFYVYTLILIINSNQANAKVKYLLFTERVLPM